MSVPLGVRFLRQRGVPHEVREYDLKVKGAEYAAMALGWPLEAMAKTLVVRLEGRTFCQCLLPGHLELSLKKLARAAGVKSARMATTEEAERLTGYLVGGISPFGVRRRMPVWIHESLMAFDRIGVNGGRRGVIVFLSPGDARDVLAAQVADLAA